MGVIINKTTLGRLYLKYILIVLPALLASGFSLLIIFNLLLVNGKILPANFAEKKIEEAQEIIADADTVTDALIPPLCEYVVFDEKGKVQEGSLSGTDVDAAWRAVSMEETQENQFFYKVYFYKVIERSDGFCVLRYRLIPQYSSAFLREHLIPPQELFIGAAFVMITGIIIFSSVRFGRKLKKKLNPLLDEVERIKAQELSDAVECSGIREIDDILCSIEDMKGALKESLEKQWQMEQEKNRQMSALAHDIKTPLTVVRGNAELLEETALTEEQKQYADYIVRSAAQMQSYVQMLIEITKSAEGVSLSPVPVSTEALFAEIRNQTEGLINTKKCELLWKVPQTGKTICIVFDQIVRAVMNIVANAIEHTPEGGVISICVEEQGEMLAFIIEDSGSGFSEAALARGTEQFFMEDESRSSALHYGIGLFTAKTIAGRHGGKLVLSNSSRFGGAKVSFLIKEETASEVLAGSGPLRYN